MCLEKRGDSYAKSLSKCVSARGKEILESGPVLASVFLDARYQVLLTQAQKKVAKDHILSILHLIKRLNSTSMKELSLSQSNTNDELESILKNAEEGSANDNNCDQLCIVEAFDNVKFTKKRKHNEFLAKLSIN